MPTGPGKYDDLATNALSNTDADAVVLIVINGHNGSGMSVSQLTSEFELASRSVELATALPGILRIVANQIESSATATVSTNLPGQSPS